MAPAGTAGAAAGVRQAWIVRYPLASRVHSTNSSMAGTLVACRTAPLTARATAVIPAPAASQRGSTRLRNASTAMAAQQTASGNRLMTVAASAIAASAACSPLPAATWALTMASSGAPLPSLSAAQAIPEPSAVLASQPPAPASVDGRSRVAR